MHSGSTVLGGGEQKDEGTGRLAAVAWDDRHARPVGFDCAGGKSRTYAKVERGKEDDLLFCETTEGGDGDDARPKDQLLSQGALRVCESRVSNSLDHLTCLERTMM